MNKLIGYCEIGPGKVPAKIGLYVLERFCKDFDVELTGIGSLFTVRKYKDAEGNEKEGSVPADLPAFLSTLMLHAVNYAGKLGGTRTYTLEEVYELIDEAGGLNGGGCSELIAQFMASIANGGTPVKPVAEEPKKKEADQ